MGHPRVGGTGSVLVECGVLLGEFLLVLGHIFEGVNRIGGAGRDAGATVDAAFGIDVHLSGGFELGLVLFRVNAVGGANLDAEGVLDAGISDYISHSESISGMKDEMRAFGSLRKECKKEPKEKAVISITGGCAPTGQEARWPGVSLTTSGNRGSQMMMITRNCDHHHRNTQATGLK